MDSIELMAGNMDVRTVAESTEKLSVNRVPSLSIPERITYNYCSCVCKGYLSKYFKGCLKYCEYTQRKV